LVITTRRARGTSSTKPRGVVPMRYESCGERASNVISQRRPLSSMKPRGGAVETHVRHAIAGTQGLHNVNSPPRPVGLTPIASRPGNASQAGARRTTVSNRAARDRRSQLVFPCVLLGGLNIRRRHPSSRPRSRSYLIRRSEYGCRGSVDSDVHGSIVAARGAFDGK
jgi:hypothetical protein